MIRNLIYFLAASTLLSACDGNNARDIIGLGKRAPDEFRVVARPPLSVPPDFTLRPPQEGAGPGYFSEGNSDAKARSIVTGSPPVQTGDQLPAVETSVGSVYGYSLPSSADQTFLQNAGAQSADPAIRERLYQELNQQQNTEKESDYLFDWLDSDADKSEVIVDAEAEKERLEKNQQENKPVTEGETPSVQPSKLAPLEKLFD